MDDQITKNYLEVRERIDQACIKAGRSRQDVHLVVVTKGHTADKIVEIVEAGASILGENYPEETIEKIKLIERKVTPSWHMIGHLQSRKIKFMYPFFSLIHSVDSLELAQKINTFYSSKSEYCDVLIEVNIAGEKTKFGFEAHSKSTRDLLFIGFEKMLTFSHLRIKGLMTMPPLALNNDQNIACYNLCYELLNRLKKEFALNEFKELSMGTSADFEAAIECGATYVRVGEAIMGKRNNPIKTE